MSGFSFFCAGIMLVFGAIEIRDGKWRWYQAPLSISLFAIDLANGFLNK